jgi:alanine-synthesizing transaminase
MEFRRIPSLPPYVFAHINDLKLQLRRAGEDVIDFGFGNPDIPSNEHVVDKLCEAARRPQNHRYSSSKGIPRLRLAICDYYRDRFGVELDPDTEAITTIGAKEGLSHLMWVLVQPGDSAVVPSPSYPIHIFAPQFAGASITSVPMSTNADFMEEIVQAFERSRPRPRVIIVSFPHNPTTAVVDLAFMQRLVDFAREQEVLIVHDFAYADTSFDGYSPPSILQAEGAKDVAVELYSLTKSWSMAGWRSAFMVGNREVVAALARLKSYLDYGTFQPIQIASIIALNECRDYPAEVNAIYQHRRDVLCEGLCRVGWEIEKPKGTMFVWAPIPEPYAEMKSLDFAIKLAKEAKVAVSPGSGFGLGGDAHIRFALIENEERTRQAIRGIRRALPELGGAAG